MSNSELNDSKIIKIRSVTVTILRCKVGPQKFRRCVAILRPPPKFGRYSCNSGSQLGAAQLKPPYNLGVALLYIYVYSRIQPRVSARF